MPYCSQCGSKNPDGFVFCGSCGRSVDPAQDPADEAARGSTKTRRRRTGLFLGALVVVLAVLAVAAWAALAPVRQNSARYVIPADAQVYVEVDLLAMTSDNAAAFMEALWVLAEDDLNTDETDPISGLDELLEEETGVTFTDDVSPWIGRHVAIAAFDIDSRELDSNGGVDELFAESLQGAGSLLVAVDVRSPELADEFLDDLANGLRRNLEHQEDMEWTFDTTRIGGVPFHEAVGVPQIARWRTERLNIYFGRSDDVILFATSEELVEDALDVQSGSESALAASSGFLEALEEFQAGAFLTAYADNRLAEDLLEFDGTNNLDFVAFDRTVGAVDWISLSASIAKDELLVASQISFDADQLPHDASAWLESIDDADVLGSLFDGYETYLLYPALGKMCPFFSSDCEPDIGAIDNAAAALIDLDWDATMVTFASTADLELFDGEVSDPPFQSVRDWEVRLLSSATESIHRDELVFWDIQREFDSPEAAVDFIETSDKLGDSSEYHSARSLLPELATTIFYFNGSQYHRAGSDWIGPVVPKTAVGGISWDGIMLRGNVTITIDSSPTASAAAAESSDATEEASTDPVILGNPLPQMPTDSQIDYTATGLAAPAVSGSDFAGNAVAIQDDGRAKVILLLAHWCPHCQEQVPELQTWLDNGGGDSSVDIFSIVTASGADRSNFPPSAWLESEGWSSPVLIDDDDGPVHNAYGEGGFPFWVFINSDGSVASRFAGAMPIDDLEQAFKNLS